MRTRINKKLFFSVLAFLSIFFVNATNTYAEAANTEKEAVEQESGFSYEVVYPENQQGNMGYYYLKMTPGQQQTLEIKLTNTGSKELEVATTLSGARTNSNGVIEYGPTELSKGDSMKFDFKDIVKGPESIKIPANSTVSVPIEVTMPDTSYDGIILGGIQLRQKKDESDAEESSNGTMVINEYAYTVGILLKETDIELDPDMKFVKAYGNQLSYKNVVTIDLENTVAKIISDVTVEAQIMKQGSEEVLYDAKKTSMRMAPNTILNFPVSMGGQSMEAGKYTAHVVATSGEKKWEWTENFEITQEEAEKFNAEAVGLTQEQGINWMLIAGIVFGVIVLFGVIFLVVFLIRKRNEKKKRELRKRKKQQQKKKSK